MIKTVIIDDEPLARGVIKEYITEYDNLQITAECSDGFEGFKVISEHSPDLVFLDIQMPKINGFEMLELFETPPPIIFTTAFDEFAIKAFEANAVDYLLKPFSKDRFARALQKFFQHNDKGPVQAAVEEAANSPLQQNRVVVKDRNNIKIIPVNKIEYLQAADDYVKITTAEGIYLKKQTMQFFENSLGRHHFVRIHRSYIVNSHMITRIDPYEKDSHMVILNTGIKLPASKLGYNNLKAALGI
ncbi:MAG: LytTR family transcriptional regulator DNA-binding domain-containing protein [Ginsengibacter sp.]